MHGVEEGDKDQRISRWPGRRVRAVQVVAIEVVLYGY